MFRVRTIVLTMVAVSGGCGGWAGDRTGLDGGASADARVGGATADARVGGATPDAATAVQPDAPTPALADAPLPGTQPQPGHSFLTVQGPTDLWIEAGVPADLDVRFANENGVPLAGVVTFRIEGDPADTMLAATSGVPSFDGDVVVTLNVGASYAKFRVVAEAPYAAAVAWNLEVLVPPPPPPDAPPPRYTLTIVGDPVVPAQAGSTVPLSFRLTDAQGQPVPSFPIQLGLIAGGAADGYLSGESTVTDADGVGKFSVALGPGLGGVNVFADTGVADSRNAMWVIEVMPPPFGVGTYALDSTFTLPTSLDGEPLAHDLADVTDDPHDPATWLLDNMDDVVRSTFASYRPGLDDAVNYAIDRDGLTSAAEEVATMTHTFGVHEELAVRVGADGALVGRLTVTGYFVVVDGTTYVDPFYGELPAIDGIPVTVASGQIQIGGHDLTGYGGAVEVALVPDLFALLKSSFDCNAVGQIIDDTTGIGSDGFGSSACVDVEYTRGNMLNGERSQLAGSVSLHVEGSAQLVDADGDGRVDRLAQGVWTGSATVNGATQPLGAGQSFTGQRAGD
jgi:hypothetical protein